MHVQVTADVSYFDELRQLPFLSGGDLTGVLPELRWYISEGELRVEFPLRRHRLVLVRPGLRQAILGNVQTSLDRSLAQHDVVCLSSGEVVQERAERLRGNDPQVHLHPAGLD